MEKMKKYIRCNVVEAMPMTRGDYMGMRGFDLSGKDYPHEEGYYMKHPDGYELWCPREAFESSGRPIDGMTFGQAIEAMKKGKKVARAGWSEKGMYLWLLSDAEVKKEWCRDPGLLEAMGDQDSIHCLGAIRVLFAAKKEVMTGWTPNSIDIFAEDWHIVD